jgi:hypothetical protein
VTASGLDKDLVTVEHDQNLCGHLCGALVRTRGVLPLDDLLLKLLDLALQAALGAGGGLQHHDLRTQLVRTHADFSFIAT